jgi:hypothetical protein
VSLARRLSTVRALPSLAMANRSDLSVRVFSLLDANRRRGRVGRAAIAGAIGVASLLVLVVAPLRAIAAPASSSLRGATVQTPPDVGAALGWQDRGARVRPAASRQENPRARREPAKPRVPRTSEKPRAPNASEKPRLPNASEKPRVPGASEKRARVSAEPRKPASAREVAWTTQSARTIDVPPRPSGGDVVEVRGSHSALESATAQHSSSATSSSGSP